ncbi:MAG TPA: hypothetical protein PKC72_11140 [Chitinophagaceae bacterium]|nr:hypothetical protein [Chitinophagaceae bacterium]
MKNLNFKPLMAIAILFSSFTFLSSFSSLPGGEGFEIYLNNKLVLQQFGTKMNDIKSISLSQAAAGDQVSIKYYHCGHVGKNRVVYIKNKANTTLKEWKYKDVSQPVAAMSFHVSEVLQLRKSSNGLLGIYYSSSELPEGRLLAKVDINSKDVTSK